jgi:hypothetical protein
MNPELEIETGTDDVSMSTEGRVFAGFCRRAASAVVHTGKCEGPSEANEALQLGGDERPPRRHERPRRVAPAHKATEESRRVASAGAVVGMIDLHPIPPADGG